MVYFTQKVKFCHHVFTLSDTVASCKFCNAFKVKCPVSSAKGNVLLHWLYISRKFRNEMSSE